MALETLERLPKELTKRFIYTIFLLLIVRTTIFIPIPGVDNLSFYKNLETNTVFNFVNNIIGGGARTIGIGTFGISPYFNATLTVQAVIKLIPEWERLQKEEGELGRRILVQRTRYITLLWAFLQSCLIVYWIKPYVFNWNISFILDTVLTLTTGAVLVMWISELISQFGLGNGSSFLVMVNIVTGFSKTFINSFKTGDLENLGIKIFVSSVLFVLMILISIFISEGKRKIKILSSRQLGTTSTVNSRSYLPLKLNSATIIPLVISSLLITLPSYFITKVNNSVIQNILLSFIPGQPLYLFAYYVLIVFLNAFYTNLLVNPSDIAENLTKLGVVIPGIRPGGQTNSYLQAVSNKLGFISATLLGVIGIVPYIIDATFKVPLFKGLSVTSLLIFVGVSTEIAKQVRTYLLSQSYTINVEK
uniref:Preprotein translocase secY subunit n=1 Tax=Bangiopsis subsimplex TaxID=139980 RepID=A0A1C9CD04_9RHOD|nr:preprotein translocase subunit SecY [Bangiopsis subsimplex]AOM66259.1 preprotein translocase subunit SecY [Bangiopsis subsimplex]ARO90379.1 preprotein translocase secY subunit [Bangiopsis subsimplex]